jgi:segregation and condensation protein B
MNEHDLKITIEATLLAAGRPVPAQQLLELFEERERPTKEQLQAALDALAQDYADRGIELVEVASGWRIQIRQRCIDTVSRLWQERPTKYSRALLETLALVAYRQPITRSEIEEIRGVSVSSTIMRTLQERNWIRVVGHREVPGRPELLGTTREFLDYFGLKSLDQLPTLAELRDVETIGVQLELPAGEPESANSEAANGDAENAAAAQEAPISADAGNGGDSAAGEGVVAEDGSAESSVAEEAAADGEPVETGSGAETAVEESAESSAEGVAETSEDMNAAPAPEKMAAESAAGETAEPSEEEDAVAESMPQEVAAESVAEEVDESSEDELAVAQSTQEEMAAEADADEQDDEQATLVAADADGEERRIYEPSRDQD